MKTKPLTSALALAALVLVASPERGSAVVAYVNVFLTNGFNFVANPLNCYWSNSYEISNVLSAVIPSPPNSTTVYLWNVASQAWGNPITYHNQTGWERDAELPVGEGFVIWSPSPWTDTIVGEPLLSSTNSIAGYGALSLVSSEFPQSGELSSALEFPGIDGADTYLYRSASHSFTDVVSYFNGFGWFDPQGETDTNGPILNLAEAFFVRNSGPPTNWVQEYSLKYVTLGKRKTNVAGTESGTDPEIQHIKIEAGQVTLVIRNPGGGVYNVQHSPDGISWQTVATNQTAAVWQGPLPAGACGYYEVVKP